MNIHKNARLTVLSRARLVQQIESGEPAAEVAAAFQVSRRTAYKWLRRWREEGEAGLVDRSSRPHRSPRRLPRSRRRQIERHRRAGRSTPWIAERLGLPVSTVVVTVRRLGLSRLPRRIPPPPVVRYERERPGELVHLDIKKLGRIGRVGHRIHGDRRARVRGIGWEYLHICIDDATRLAYGEILDDERSETATAFLRRAAAWFAALDVRIERVMTDNGSAYRSRQFRAAVHELGARPLKTRPYTPRTNGKAERFIRTALEGWAYVRAYRTSRERTAALRAFLAWYNTVRKHWAIGKKTPQQRLLELNLSANHI